MIGENDRVTHKIRFRLISPEGQPMDTFATAGEAARAAGSLWPGIEQRDHDNGGAGWDIEVVR